MTHQVFGEQEIFYRAMCRRFFCSYMGDTRPASSILHDFDETITVRDVTRSLSGVIFLEDNSICQRWSSEGTTADFAYFNPNAFHKPRRIYREHHRSLKVPIDDFEHDNY